MLLEAHEGIQAQKVLLLGPVSVSRGSTQCQKPKGHVPSQCLPPKHQPGKCFPHSLKVLTWVKSKLNLTVSSHSQTGRTTSGERVCAGGVKVRRGGIVLGVFAPLGVEEWVNSSSLTWWGRGCRKITAEHPCHPHKGLERTQGNLPIFPGQACRGRGGSPRALPSMPHVVPLPADGKYWCCDFINKGFCEPEKHGIRMNYFLSCGLARFANLGVFGPSPGNKPKSLSKRHRCSGKGRSREE